MTQVIIVPLNGTKRPDRKLTLDQLSKMVEGACNIDGSWRQGWEPSLVQCYLRKEDLGVYTIVHNINKLNYSLSVSLIKSSGNIVIKDQSANSFTIETWPDSKLQDCAFRFAISVLNDNPSGI